MEFVNLGELEARAREHLEDFAYDYYSSGANDEITLGENREAFDRRRLWYRVLVDVAERSLTTRVLGKEISMPVLVAPTAFHRLACEAGELATARAAAAAGTVMVLSTLSNTSVEDVVAAAREVDRQAAVWFQLYVYRDREATAGLVERAVAAGCSALVLTVDAPLLGRRERDVQNRFALPPGLEVKNLLPVGLGAVETEDPDSGLAGYFASQLDPSLSWKDLEWLRSLTEVPILVKGVVRPDDALRARDHGAAGVVVSNHGGRQLDTAPATIDALEPIAEALAREPGSPSFEVLLDGGVRRGTDVIKALALGARAVLLGRPILWGLALDGQSGAGQVLELMRREVDLAMALCGCREPREVGRDLLGPG